MRKRPFPELPGWTLESEEESAGVYRVSASDDAGRRVELSGTNYDALVDDVRRWAVQHERDVPTGSEPANKALQTDGASRRR